MEQSLILRYVQIVGTGKISSTRKLERELRIVESREDVRDDGLLIDVDAENLALLVDTNDSVRALMLSSDEDGLARDTVHVDARARLEVVDMDEAVLGDEVDDAVLLRDLHSYWEIVCCLWREEHVNSLLLEYRISCLVVDFNNMKLQKAEQLDTNV